MLVGHFIPDFPYSIEKWYFQLGYLLLSNLCAVLLAIDTSHSMAGTSTRTPTTVANAAPDRNPNRLMATATASSKKLDAPIRAAGAAML